MIVTGLNRNILECKSGYQPKKEKRKNVLIETYWNVNKIIHHKNGKTDSVLIETYWNVNDGHFGRFIGGEVSLNRNILECK